MNKALLYLSVVSTSLAMYGFADKALSEKQEKELYESLDGRIEIILDTETGCKYIFVKDDSEETNILTEKLVKIDKAFGCD